MRKKSIDPPEHVPEDSHVNTQSSGDSFTSQYKLLGGPPSPLQTMSSHGLVYPDHFLAALPVVLPRPAPHTPIRAINASQFAKIHLAHLTSDVPDAILFPFLHGLEGDNHAQTQFFSKNGAPVAVPNYRGLIWALAEDDDHRLHDDELFLENDDHASPVSAELEMRAETLATDIPGPSSSSSSFSHYRRPSDVDSTFSSSAESIFSRDLSSSALSIDTAATSLHSSFSSASLTSPCPNGSSSCLTSHLLTSTFHPSDLLMITNDGRALFIPPNVPKGISLRNFGIQTPIYATLSDVVVYSPKGLTRSAFACAERFKQAIEAKYHQRTLAYPDHPPPVIYNVYVVTDPFTVFERDFPDLVGVTTKGIPVNHVCFPEREMQEMQELTKASEIHPGVFVGNSADVPIWERGDPEAPFDSSTNPDGYDICIECHDQGQFPQPSLLKQAEDHLAALDALWETGYAGGGGGLSLFSSAASSAAPPRPPPNANTVLHFSFPATPPAAPAALMQPFISFLQSVLHRPRRCKILVYSHDGYTESSVLALTLLMAERRCSLPEAYLDLQLVTGRSFFVHRCDMDVLKRIETRYARGGERERERAGEAGKAGKEKWGWGAFMRGGGQGGGSASTPALSSSIPNLGSGTTMDGPQQHSGTPRRARAQTSPLLPNPVDHQAWFNDERFDGSFPSRVLPFLYLGNIQHASNVYMLHALGITHVVSVGECALVPPLDVDASATSSSAPEHQVVLSHGRRRGSLWREEREGRIKVLDIKGVCDDGIDSLRPAFASIYEWIDKARVEGGKVLVHCRVGVSRSATVTIAYVMKHLNISLVDAYLIVRSRRLSVLIQPNMRLLYNLCGWEVELARERARGEVERGAGRGEAVMARALRKALNWPYLAREVHMLNEKYLH